MFDALMKCAASSSVQPQSGSRFFGGRLGAGGGPDGRFSYAAMALHSAQFAQSWPPVR
jgi:hypothetical protein